MAGEWVYSINNKLLSSPYGEQWEAASGPWGNGALPSGPYTIGHMYRYGATGMGSYRDSAGNAWWCPISPQFSTPRTGLGIHPDGGVAGTKGCIGLKAYDTSSARYALDISFGQTLKVIG